MEKYEMCSGRKIEYKYKLIMAIVGSHFKCNQFLSYHDCYLECNIKRNI